MSLPIAAIASTSITFLNQFGSGAFTATGTKGLQAGSITYNLYP